mmetsp:Transcript_22642/g.34936  ORF Transcript_22642/g.34936 Transcript_22642/m.34936 type:complete len:104 (-) Transcript_22642:905-1216(-)
MILLYCFLGLLLSTIVCPLLFCKAAINICYLEVTAGLRNKGSSLMWIVYVFKLFIKVAVLPLLIVVSLLIDFLKLTTSLLQDEKYFEYKYQDSIDQMEPPQTR